MYKKIFFSKIKQNNFFKELHFFSVFDFFPGVAVGIGVRLVFGSRIVVASSAAMGKISEDADSSCCSGGAFSFGIFGEELLAFDLLFLVEESSLLLLRLVLPLMKLAPALFIF